MRFAFTSLALVAALAACSDASPTTAPVPIRAASFDDLPEQRWHQREDLQLTDYVRCWGEEGELVSFDGALHFVYTVKRDGMGRTTLTQHGNLQGLRGIGWESGLRYVATDNWSSREMYLPGEDVPEGWTFSDRWKFHAQGSARDFVRVLTWRMTKDATGELVVVKESDTVECR